MRTFATVAVLLLILLFSCKKKKETPVDPITPTSTPTTPIPGTDTIVYFKISLFNSPNYQWYTPRAFVKCSGYQSKEVALTTSTITETLKPPCDEFYMKEAHEYALQDRKS